MKKDLSSIQVKPPAHSLELNLLLVFLAIAGRKYGLTERHILVHAQSNELGYLTLHRDHFQLVKNDSKLRPINVPFLSKWVREVIDDLCGTDQLSLPKVDLVQSVNKFGADL